MSDISTGTYAKLLDRLNSTDPAVHAAAVNQLFEKGYDRLHRLAAKIMKDYTTVSPNVDSVVSLLYLRLRKAFESDTVRPANPGEYYKFAAHKIRHVLLDYVEEKRRLARVGQFPLANGSQTSSGNGFDPAQSTQHTSNFDEWTKLHSEIQKLPEDLQTVFCLRYYLDLTNAEIAEGLGLHPKQVSRLWLEATHRLARHLPA